MTSRRAQTLISTRLLSVSMFSGGIDRPSRYVCTSLNNSIPYSESHPSIFNPKMPMFSAKLSWSSSMKRPPSPFPLFGISLDRTSSSLHPPSMVTKALDVHSPSNLFNNFVSQPGLHSRRRSKRTWPLAHQPKNPHTPPRQRFEVYVK